MKGVLFSLLFSSQFAVAQVPPEFLEQAAKSNPGLKVKFNEYFKKKI